MLRELFFSTVAAFFVAGFQPCHAWENHSVITRLTLHAYEEWEIAIYEPIEKVLPELSFHSTEELAQSLKIHGSRVKWDWQPTTEAQPTMLDVLAYSAAEPDNGMDQNLDLSPDQKYMGGYTGLTSQAIRHMYYRPWSILEPFVTFHFPIHEMGQAPERAEVYFDLAAKAMKTGHSFWAHRFLGWGMHYVQDLGQPYHASQFSSFSLLPLWVLIKDGWNAFVLESTRLVSNYHLAFEHYVQDMLLENVESELVFAFKVPTADQSLKFMLEQSSQEVSIQKGIYALAIASSRVASSIVSKQKPLMGKILESKEIDLGKNFFDESGKPKIDFKAIDLNAQLVEPRQKLIKVTSDALSNTGVATRWYFDRFRAKQKTVE